MRHWQEPPSPCALLVPGDDRICCWVADQVKTAHVERETCQQLVIGHNQARGSCCMAQVVALTTAASIKNMHQKLSGEFWHQTRSTEDAVRTFCSGMGEAAPAYSLLLCWSQEGRGCALTWNCRGRACACQDAAARQPDCPRLWALTTSTGALCNAQCVYFVAKPPSQRLCICLTGSTRLGGAMNASHSGDVHALKYVRLFCGW